MNFPLIYENKTIFPSLVGGYGVAHDWAKVEKTLHKQLYLQNKYFSLYKVKFPKYHCISLDSKIIKQQYEDDSFTAMERIQHDLSTVYVDYQENPEDTYIEFFGYEDKSKVGSGDGFAVLKLLAQSFFRPLPLTGAVPHIKSRYGGYQKLLKLYLKNGWKIVEEVEFNSNKQTLIRFDISAAPQPANPYISEIP